MTVESETGKLFGTLWHQLNDDQYRQSVALFSRRFEANGFDLNWFKGKRCLDAGCGSGRYSIAIALQGAAEVVGCDISESGLSTARERAAHLPVVRFEKGSVLALPFRDGEFDFVCCAGVLHHTESISRGLDELTRVLKPGGKIFLLLYGAGGLRWKLITSLRPLAEELGINCLDAAIKAAGLPANNRKHFLDDLYVPIQKLVRWSDLESCLEERGYTPVERWMLGRFDHEASPEAQLADMHKLRNIFSAVRRVQSDDAIHSHVLSSIGENVAAAFIDQAQRMIKDAKVAPEELNRVIIGEGNHRVLATKR
jgi:ubiquinone/menaquinone biosynthesis C-methylase UbiE